MGDFLRYELWIVIYVLVHGACWVDSSTCTTTHRTSSCNNSHPFLLSSISAKFDRSSSHKSPTSFSPSNWIAPYWPHLQTSLGPCPAQICDTAWHLTYSCNPNKDRQWDLEWLWCSVASKRIAGCLVILSRGRCCRRLLLLIFSGKECPWNCLWRFRGWSRQLGCWNSGFEVFISCLFRAFRTSMAFCL